MNKQNDNEKANIENNNAQPMGSEFAPSDIEQNSNPNVGAPNAEGVTYPTNNNINYSGNNSAPVNGGVVFSDGVNTSVLNNMPTGGNAPAGGANAFVPVNEAAPANGSAPVGGNVPVDGANAFAPADGSNSFTQEGEYNSFNSPNAEAFSPNQDPNGVVFGDGAGTSKKSKLADSQVVKSFLGGVAGALVLFVVLFLLNSVGIVRINSSSSANIADIGKTSVPESSEVEGSNSTTPNWNAVNVKVASSVVSVKITTASSVGMGSGVIIDKDGDIVTNNHVVALASTSSSQKGTITVMLQSGVIYKADVKGTDPTSDLAVLKMQNPPSDLTVASFGDSGKVKVGEPVMAIGNPLGYANTTTTGVVSALDRPVASQDESGTSSDVTVTNAIQIDAAINSGNSGGPLFDGNGKVIGITSSIATSGSSTGSIGIGFAIPSNPASKVAQELISDGKAKHALLGATLKDSDATADGVTRSGAQLVTITKGGAAEKAGLKANDVVVAIDGKAVTNNYSLMGYIREYNPNDTAKLTIVRDGKSQNVNVVLDTAPDQTQSDSNNNDNNNDNGSNGGGSGMFDPFDYLFGGK
jgi:putative serine protease PepD